MTSPSYLSMPGGRILAVPSFHSNLQFALAVRAAFFEEKPDCIAVELPESLYESVIEAVNYLPYLSIVHYQEDATGRHCYVPMDPCDSMIEAIRLGIQHDIPIHFIDLDVDNYRQRAVQMPDDYAIKKIGFEQYMRLITKSMKRSSCGSKDHQRERYMSGALLKLRERYEKILFVFGANHFERISGLLTRESRPVQPSITRDQFHILGVGRSSSSEVLKEMPYITFLYEISRGETPPSLPKTDKRHYRKLKNHIRPFDRVRAIERILYLASRIHSGRFDERISPHILHQMIRYIRNYALLENRLTPNAYHLIVGAQNMVNDDFAVVLWELLEQYPFQDENGPYRKVDIRNQQMDWNGKRVRIRRRLPVGSTVSLPIPLRRNPTDEEKRKWKSEWTGRRYCSYFPEDDLLERAMKNIRRKAVESLEEHLITVQEFQADMKDGIDMRATIRDFHLGGKIYVREIPRLKIDIGPVIIIFDREFDRYPVRMTWKKEFPADIERAFYSDQPGEHMVGPGISRSRYGGCLSYDYMPTSNAFSDFALEEDYTCIEILLAAAILSSREKHIAFVDVRPPSVRMRSLAEANGKILIHLPPYRVDPGMLHRIRTFHILNHPSVRVYAKKYISLSH